MADYTLLLFEETVKAIFNKAMREGLVKFNPVHSLNKLERFHAPDKHREYLTPEELTRFLAVEAECELSLIHIYRRVVIGVPFLQLDFLVSYRLPHPCGVCLLYTSRCV